MAYDAYDTHLCLACNLTIFGLENYVSHRRSSCPVQKPGVTRSGKRMPSDAAILPPTEHPPNEAQPPMDVSVLHSIAEQVSVWTDNNRADDTTFTTDYSARLSEMEPIQQFDSAAAASSEPAVPTAVVPTQPTFMTTTDSSEVYDKIDNISPTITITDNNLEEIDAANQPYLIEYSDTQECYAEDDSCPRVLVGNIEGQGHPRVLVGDIEGQGHPRVLVGNLEAQGQVVDPNMVLSAEDKDVNINDFLSLLDLQMKPGGGTKGGGIQFDPAEVITDTINKDDNSSDDRLDKMQALKIASILSDLQYSSESEDEMLLGCDDILTASQEVLTDMLPPCTGGKWEIPPEKKASPEKKSPQKQSGQAGKGKYNGGKWKSAMERDKAMELAMGSGKDVGEEEHDVQSSLEGVEGKLEELRSDEVVMKSSKKKVGRPVSRKRKHTGGKVWRNIVEQSKAFAEKESSQRPHKKVRQSKSTPGSYHCHICDRTLLTASNYQNHMKCALHKKRSKSVGRNAIKQEKKPTFRIECPICQKMFERKYSFISHLTSTGHRSRCTGQKHMVRLTGKLQLMLLRFSPYQCQICSYYSKEWASLNIHVQQKSHCNKAAELLGPILCVRCKVRFADNDALVAHMQTDGHVRTVTESQRPCVIKESRHRIECPVCHRIQGSVTVLKKHLERHKSSGLEVPFKRGRPSKNRTCSFCKKICHSTFQMITHIRRFHTHQKPFSCKFCDISFVEKYSLTIHNRSQRHLSKVMQASLDKSKTGDKKLPVEENCASKAQSSRGKIKCRHCDFVTDEYGNLRPHYLDVHANKLDCDVCVVTFKKTESLLTHLTTQSHAKKERASLNKCELTYKCSQCDKRFLTESRRKMHELSHGEHILSEQMLWKMTEKYSGINHKYHAFLDQHMSNNKTGRVSCPECNKVMTTVNLFGHLRNHEGSKPFACALCEVKFVRPETLRRHLQDFHFKMHDYECMECGKTFFNNDKLRTHVLYTHSKAEKKLKCQDCGKMFHQLGRLNAHRKIHNKHIACLYNTCHLMFSNQGEMLLHYRVHSQEKPYMCTMCPYSGKSRNQLTRHIRTHTGERNYHCEYCTYKAQTSTHLKRHMRSHVGSKPYVCPYCTYRANTHENMRKHILETKRHKGLPIYPCQTNGCKYGTNMSKNMRKHLIEVHNLTAKEISHVAIYSGLYDKSADVSELPEGAHAKPVLERNHKSPTKTRDGERP